MDLRGHSAFLHLILSASGDRGGWPRHSRQHHCSVHERLRPGNDLAMAGFVRAVAGTPTRTGEPVPPFSALVLETVILLRDDGMSGGSVTYLRCSLGLLGLGE